MQSIFVLNFNIPCTKNQTFPEDIADRPYVSTTEGNSE